MNKLGICIGAGILVAIAGCANRQKSADKGAPQAQAGPAHDPNDPAWMSLDNIQPAPKLAAPKAPTTQKAPLEALQLYARARAALAGGSRQTAINLLEKAIALDSASPELFEELGRAYGGQEKALWAYGKAIELDPDNLGLYERMGRQYFIKGKFDDALHYLRLALQTTEYRENEESAAVIDFFSARVLHRKGYDRAALEQYAVLVKRLSNPALMPRSNSELVGLLTQPELIYGQIGELYERHQEYGEAVEAYKLAVERIPDNWDLQSRLTRVLVDAGRGDEAEKRAADLVTQFRANSDSLNLLKEIYKKRGREAEIVEVLSRLHAEKPKDQSILFALADALKSTGRREEAERLLYTAAKNSDNDAEILKRLFAMFDERDDVEGAVRLLINALAEEPDSLRELSPLWTELLKPSRRNRVRLPLLQRIKVAPEAEASRLFWVSRVADLWNRDALSRSAVEQAVTIKPPFAPACRLVIVDYWMRPDWDEKQKIAACQKVIDQVVAEGNPALAAELEGLSLLRQKKPREAADALARSIRLGNKSPDVQLTQASALRAAGEGPRAEQIVWKVISDTPTYEDAYMELFGYYFASNAAGKAVNVLGKWLSADPGNVRARVLRAQLMQRAGRAEAAEGELLSLFRDQPESQEILAALYEFYLDSRRIEEFITKLEEERKERPNNREAIETLATIYHEQKRLPDALRVLDSARQAVANDPDLLYYLAHVYGRLDQKETEEKLLEEVVRLDPRHAPGCNDLGYYWTEAGRNLGRAEDLIRIAVETEPDNQSFLDSLGWVLYKRSKFSESLVWFEKAIGPAARPDPVVLDHMGDVHYRLNQPDEAIKRWKWAQKRLDEVRSEREDLKKLRLELIQKLRQHEEGRPVDVAPVVEGSAAASQAKN